MEEIKNIIEEIIEPSSTAVETTESTIRRPIDLTDKNNQERQKLQSIIDKSFFIPNRDVGYDLLRAELINNQNLIEKYK